MDDKRNNRGLTQQQVKAIRDLKSAGGIPLLKKQEPVLDTVPSDQMKFRIGTMNDFVVVDFMGRTFSQIGMNPAQALQFGHALINKAVILGANTEQMRQIGHEMVKVANELDKENAESNGKEKDRQRKRHKPQDDKGAE